MTERFFLPRTCQELSAEEEASALLSTFREREAYVLVGAPGAGKSRAFKEEADASGGHYISAQDFATFLDDTYNGKTLFIDGLDEARAAHGAAPLMDIRRHLRRLGNPRFRLSCREIDWLGDTDRRALAEVTPSGEAPSTLHLVPLTDQEIRRFLEHLPSVPDAEAFFREAEQHQLIEVLRNPQMLTLFAKAVTAGDGMWPNSTAEVYERACRAIAVEVNPIHQAAMRGRSYSVDQILDTAGFLCATLLLSGGAGFSVTNVCAVPDVTPLTDLMFDDTALLVAALTSDLFVGVGESGHTYVHRSIAEYLGGRYLGQRIEQRGIPAERYLAMCTSADGGVTPALRGLCAWMSMESRSARLAFVPLDPLGTVLYGDVMAFSRDDKGLVFKALECEAQASPAFRAGDRTPHPFGSLATRDMLAPIQAMLAPRATSPGEQAFQDCVLEAVRHGEPMSEVEPRLIEIARDPGYWNRVRQTAIEAIEQVSPTAQESLMGLLDGIMKGEVEDEEDELLGYLLERLYARGALPETRVLDYLRAPKNPNFIGSYFMFWSPHLAAVAPADDLPALLHAVSQRRTALEDQVDSHRLEGLGGDLLRGTLEAHGDTASDEDIYGWLSCVLDRYEHAHLDHDDRSFVDSWLSARGDRYKAQVRLHVDRCRSARSTGACLNRMWSRLFNATPPADMVSWYLDRAAEEADDVIAQHYFDAAITLLCQQGRCDILSAEKLDYVGTWVASHAKMEPWLAERTSWKIDDYRREEWNRANERAREKAEGRRAIVDSYRPYLAALRAGNAPLGVVCDLARAYAGRFYQAHGDTPPERLQAFFGDEPDVIEAAFESLAKTVDSPELPRVDEIVGRLRNMFLRDPALIGMSLRHTADADAALGLDPAILKRLVAFRLSGGESDDPAWYVALARGQPALVAGVMTTFVTAAIDKGDTHILGVYALANSDELATVAPLAIPPMLGAFPRRSFRPQLRTCLDPLLKGALHHMVPAALEALIDRKLANSKLGRGQQTLWLAAGLLTNQAKYEAALLAHVGNREYERGLLTNFLAGEFPRRAVALDLLPDATLVQLVKLLGPAAPAMRTGAYRRGADDQMGDLVRMLLRNLEQRSSDATLGALGEMLTLNSLEPWRYSIQSAQAVVRIARRTATAPKLTARAVTLVLADNAPASSADLAALTFGHLRDLERLIRDESTNDYNQYWDTSATPPKPKPENICRDALLSDLKQRLDKYGVGATGIKEANMVDDKRADILVSYGGATGFAVPVEAKKEDYSTRRDGKKETVWTGLRSQLIDCYVREPAADGNGIYLVFWFGGAGLPPPPSGPTPTTPAELERALSALLQPDEGRIRICVVDCSRPA